MKWITITAQIPGNKSRREGKEFDEKANNIESVTFYHTILWVFIVIIRFSHCKPYAQTFLFKVTSSN